MSFGNGGQIAQFCTYLRSEKYLETITTIGITAENDLDELSLFKKNFFEKALVLRTLSGDENTNDKTQEKKSKEADDSMLKEYNSDDEEDQDEQEDIDERADILGSI